MRYLLALVALQFSIGCSQPFEQGKRIYDNRCANCHMSDGSGLGSAIPRLSPFKIESYDLDLACLIREGIPDATYTPMPANKDLSPAEITNLINYLRSEFAKVDKFADPRKVEEVLATCQ